METAGALGIDLGASYSCVGVVQGDKVEIIPNDLGQKTTPSFIFFKDHHPTKKYHVETVIGQAAKDQVKSFLCKKLMKLTFCFFVDHQRRRLL